MRNAMDRDFDLGLTAMGVEIARPGEADFARHRFDAGGRTYWASRTHSHAKNRSPVSSYAFQTALPRPDGEDAGDGSAGAFRSSGREPAIAALRPVILGRESSGTRLATRLGLARDVQTGDPSFDAAVFVESVSDTPTVARLFASAEAREAILALLRRGAERVILQDSDGPAVRIEIAGSRASSRIFDGDRVEALVLELGRLADALPPVRAIVSKPSTDRIALVLLLLFLGATGLACKVVEMVRVDRFGVLAPREGEAMLGSIAFLVLAAWLAARRRPLAIAFFTYSALAGAVCGPLAVDGTVGLLNYLLDEPRHAEGRVVEQRESKKGNDPRVTVAVEGRLADYGVPAAEWTSLTPGTAVDVVVGNGALGIPWYRRNHVVLVR